MNKQLSLSFGQNLNQSLKQTQRLMMSPQMQQAIQLLQLPIMELEQVISQEIEQNPILEYSESADAPQDLQLLENRDAGIEEVKEGQELEFEGDHFEVLKKLDDEFKDHFAQSGDDWSSRTREDEKKEQFRQTSIVSEFTLCEHLKQQVDETFDNLHEREMAYIIVDSLDDRGFLENSLEEISAFHSFEMVELEEVLSYVQGLDPLGVGARSLQEALLIQLRGREKAYTLAYSIIENHFDDLLKNKLPQIQKGLGASLKEIKDSIDKDIAGLSFKPGANFDSKSLRPITADVEIRNEGGALVVDGRHDALPPLRLNPVYLEMLREKATPVETKDYIEEKISSSKWIIRSLHQRNDTLSKIASVIASAQKEFLMSESGKLVPMTMKYVAEKVEVHESTIARAVANKYIATPRGLIPLRSFFTNAYVTDDGDDISSKTVKEKLLHLVDAENKNKPFSDEMLSKMLKEGGIPCARRTVAKYRRELHIGNTSERRSYV